MRAVGRQWPLILLAAIAMLLILAFLIAVVLAATPLEPSWLLDTTGLTAAERVAAQNDFRATMLTGLGGLALIAGAAVGAANDVSAAARNREADASRLPAGTQAIATVLGRRCVEHDPSYRRLELDRWT